MFRRWRHRRQRWQRKWIRYSDTPQAKSSRRSTPVWHSARPAASPGGESYGDPVRNNRRIGGLSLRKRLLLSSPATSSSSFSSRVCQRPNRWHDSIDVVVGGTRGRASGSAAEGRGRCTNHLPPEKMYRGCYGIWPGYMQSR